MKKGIFEFEVNGEKRGLKFGTYGLGVACDKEKCSVDVLYKRIGQPYIEGEGENKTVKRDPVNLMALLHLFYGAAVHYAESVKREVDFSASDVSDWLDALGVDRVNEIMTEGLNQYIPKNSKSPAVEKGEAVTA